jgi:hypothetical protein
MDVIDLPVVSIKTQLTDALGVMKTNGRSGLVAVENDVHWLFTAGWVVIGIARGKKNLADVDKRWRAQIVTPPTSVNTASYQHVEDFLDGVSENYMLFTPGPVFETAKIVTRHEGLSQALSLAPSICYCTNPNRPDDPHGYSPPLPPGNRCKFDGSPIVCAN